MCNDRSDSRAVWEGRNRGVKRWGKEEEPSNAPPLLGSCGAVPGDGVTQEHWAVPVLPTSSCCRKSSLALNMGFCSAGEGRN